MSILKTALLQGNRSVTLFYANRDPDSAIFAHELDELHAEHGARLTVTHWFDSIAGVPTVDRLTALVGAGDSREVFVCGPGPFMDAVGSAVAAARVPHSRFHREVFSSISGDPFAAVPAPDSGADAPSAPTVDTTVVLDGLTHRFDWSTDRTLVDALLAKNVDVPYSCRSGECGSCACRVTRGSVTTNSGDLLDPEDIADGYVLGCQSRPEEGPIDIEF